MAWLSRLPKRRVVSGLDLDDAVPPVSPNAPQDLAQNALDLTCEESATPRRKRLRRRLLEEKENVIFEPERSVEGCPTAASSRTEEMRISERPRSQDVEPVPRRRLLRHSISEESVIFPDRPDEPTLTGRRRLRQSISEESLIFPERLPQREVQQNLQTVEALEPRSTATSGTPTPCPTASAASRLPQRRAVVVPDLEEPRRSASEAPVSRPATFASLELEEGPERPPRAGAGPNPNRVRPSLRPIEVEESQPDPPDLQEISEDSDAESPPPPPAAEVQRWNRRGRQLPGFERFTDERLARLLQERERAFASNRRWHLEHLEARPWHLRALELLSQEAARAAQANALAALRPGRFPGRPARPPGPGGRARGGGARWQHLEGRELTADDYETLLQLDSAGPSVSSDDQAVEVQRLISMLPCSKLPAGARSRECMICLDQMEAGHEVRTLPCMHVFHSECIDKWFRTSERRPICPIDKEEVQVD